MPGRATRGSTRVGEVSEGGAVWTRDLTVVSVEGVDKAGWSG